MNSKEPLDFIFKMSRTPGILIRTLEAMRVKHFSIKKDLSRKDGISRNNPQQISIKITNLCNLRCKTCGQWGETGYNFEKPVEEIAKIVPVERYLTLVDEVKKNKPLYYIWGGEPFLYPGLFELTAKIKREKSILAVVTNATFLEKNIEAIVDQGWDALMFSLDGTENIHDEIRGKKGTFRKMADGIKALADYKKRKGKILPYIMPLVTVSVRNAGMIDEIYNTACDLKADCVAFYYSWFTNKKIGEKHAMIFKDKLSVNPEAWKGYLFDHNVDSEKLIQSINRIKKGKRGIPHIFIPNLATDEIPIYYNEPGNFFGYGPCVSPWFVAEIMPNGDVATCRDYPDYITGNIMKESFKNIWNGERYIKFRKTLLECGGTFPICSRCCGLMGW